ncbi:flagellar biosynthetic protein FliR [Neotabrizicola sp. VNH66]|uniref:flagellar biosynthetic protein FliR n=1 Tax=Neotabrizicola sp. VNH66 TaxID=3400918 RepID=UPI003BFF6154
MTELLTGLTQAAGLAEGAILHMAMVFLRVGAAVFLLPAVGEILLPQRIRLAAAVALTMVVAPAVPEGPAPGPAAFLAEAAAGLALGAGLRLMILALQMAGTIAAQSVSLAQMFSGTGPEPQPIVANALTMAGLALFVATDGVARAAALLVLSYEVIPPGQPPDPGMLAQWGVARIGHSFALAFTLAAPFVLAALLYNLALGVINRAMPSLMVSFVGAPALTLGGLALTALTAPLLLEVWQAATTQALSQPFGP